VSWWFNWGKRDDGRLRWVGIPQMTKRLRSFRWISFGPWAVAVFHCEDDK